MSQRRSGFTLIELLVVIAIIAIIASISLMVARSVRDGGKASATQSIIKSLDGVLSNYTMSRDGKVPWKYIDPTGNEFPIVDARVPNQVPASYNEEFDVNRDYAQPSIGLFSLLMKDVPDAYQPLTQLGSQFLDSRQASFLPLPPCGSNVVIPPRGASPWFEFPNEDDDYYPYGPPDYCSRPIPPGQGNVGRIRTAFGVPKNTDGTFVTPIFVKDGWGRPIRFVHPKYAGGFGAFDNGTSLDASRADMSVTYKQGGNLQTATLRRSYRPFLTASSSATQVGDADEGIPITSQPYFYSGGVDGDPGTRSDNVYSVTPKFQAETANLK